jgi:hypothetical protein
MLVRDDLDLDMARSAYNFFQEDRGIPERFECFAAGTGQGLVELAGGTNATNAMTASAGSGLDENGISEALGLPPGITQGLHWSAAPVSHRYVGLFGEPLRRYLVAQAPHDVAVRADEDDPHVAAEIGKFGVLGYEAPPHPNRFGTGLPQGTLEVSVVDIATLEMMGVGISDLRRTERYAFVSLTNEHRVPVRIGVERDGPQTSAVLQIEFPRSMDKTHGGFATINDDNSFKFPLHSNHHSTRLTGRGL